MDNLKPITFTTHVMCAFAACLHKRGLLDIADLQAELVETLRVSAFELQQDAATRTLTEDFVQGLGELRAALGPAPRPASPP